MSQNDAIVLKANFKQWQSAQSDGIGDIQPWLYYCVEQFVKPYLLDDEEIQAGITDGSGDGGADAIFIIANQRHSVSETNPVDEKSVSKLRVIFIQVKESGGFKPTEIEKFIILSEDFFDLSKSPDGFGDRYNSVVTGLMKVWRETRLRVSQEMPDFFVDYIYITGGDATPDNYAIDAGDRVTGAVKKFDNAACSFSYIGAEQLWTQVQRRPPRTKTLTWSETPMQAAEGTVGLVNLRSYFEFLEDEPGVLAERLFEENVRGYQQEVPVNRAIAESLADTASSDNFWLLNNGVTIVTAKSQPEAFRSVTVRDPQIVNGLQTSREIFKYFSTTGATEDKRSLLVRVIQTDDENLQAKITSATNNQNRMQSSQLRMTERIHRDLEELFKHHGLFYDRQKGLYKDRGKPAAKIVSVNELVQATAAIILQKPNDARARPGDFFKSQERYDAMFAPAKFPLEAYLWCVQFVRKVEHLLRTKGVERGDLKNLKFYVAAAAAQELAGTAMPPAATLAKLKGNYDEAIDAAYVAANRIYRSLSAKTDRDTVARGTEFSAKMNGASKRRLRRIKDGRN